ncbi:Hypothetical predicted protein [Xyrichtys novacula]|uniref:Uncharacterized protein n=1 Tax=Xyrichtys novacula TaxID=13765 RepID=A0AAV1FUH7_XYRNO|nr:Hypothetical predicted protein [Xyrichtys novacula]
MSPLSYQSYYNKIKDWLDPCVVCFKEAIMKTDFSSLTVAQLILSGAASTNEQDIQHTAKSEPPDQTHTERRLPSRSLQILSCQTLCCCSHRVQDSKGDGVEVGVGMGSSQWLQQSHCHKHRQPRGQEVTRDEERSEWQSPHLKTGTA